jgi:hypothetical protein
MEHCGTSRTANEESNVTAAVLTSIRELDLRANDGIQVRLLWCEHDGRLWVAVIDTKSGDAFLVQVRDGEPPLDVFRHPYAYAAHHGVETSTPSTDDSAISVAA